MRNKADKQKAQSCRQCIETHPLGEEHWTLDTRYATSYAPICRKCQAANAKKKRNEKKRPLSDREREIYNRVMEGVK